MIKLRDAGLISVLPPSIKEDSDVQAVSYAFQMGMQKMLDLANLSSVLANIDELPEKILDLLAIEMRSQYYDESMDIEIKRNIIKNSLAWYAKGGTVSAVDEMIQTVFGEGEVVEWFDFNGEPGTFYIETNAELSPDTISQFNEIIDNVKNMKSQLIDVRVNRKIPQQLYIKTCSRNIPHIIVKDNGLNNVRHTVYTTVKTVKMGHIIIKEREG